MTTIDFTDLVDLAAERLGGAVLAANDEFFAPKENLLKTAPPVFVEGRYTDVGKWMDGWETRRRREPGHDWAIVRLGLPGVPRGVIVDTAHFRGNYPESCSLDAGAVDGHPTPEELLAAAWTEILPRSPLQGDTANRFELPDLGRVTHLRLNIHPDGGVARLRVHGEVLPDWQRLARRGEIDLAGVENGGRVLACSDMFFGNRHNLILPGPSLGMHDGWETKRRRGPGNDWAIVRLGRRGHLHRVEVDTSHFKGNAPGSCALAACDIPGDPSDAVWQPLLPRTPLRPHTRHLFDDLSAAGPFTHVRLDIYPDGGVARLRLFGALLSLDRLDALPPADAEAVFRACCGSQRWAHQMAAARPFRDPAHLLDTADRLWRQLDREGWREAFAAHPRIGERKPGDRWSAEEQSGTAAAAAPLLAELAAANHTYEERFGFLFLVCATGKSAEEMLGLLRARLGNDPETELCIAAEEQRKITHLRLVRWLEGA